MNASTFSQPSSRSPANSASNESQPGRRFRLVEGVRSTREMKQPEPKAMQANQSSWPAPDSFMGRIFVNNRWERGVRFTLIVTLLYLFLECSFSAWLVDVMAGESSASEISNVENVGRLLSGFALALMCWPMMLKKGKTWIGSLFMLALTTVPIMTATYFFEKGLINRLVEDSTAESRAAAMAGTMLHQGMVLGAVDESMFDGLWARGNSQSVAGKAFAGVVAYMVAGSDTARANTMSLAPKLISSSIASKVGGLDSEYDRFTQSQSAIREKFAAYQDGVIIYRQELAKADPAAVDAWEDYLDKIERRNKYWGRKYIDPKKKDVVPGFARAEVKRKLRSEGLPVPESWSTGDRTGFIRIYKEEYAKKVRAKALRTLPDNLKLETFAAHPEVQKQWRAILLYPNNAPALPLAPVAKTQFDAKIYQPVLKLKTEDQMRSLNSQALTFGPRGTRAKEGERAYEAMIAPVFALTLSLIGAITHITKSLLLLIQITTGLRFRDGRVKGVFILAIVAIIFQYASSHIETDLTSHPTYKSWMQASASAKNHSAIDEGVIFTLDAMIKLQTHTYPIFDSARTVTLGAVDYIQATASDFFKNDE